MMKSEKKEEKLPSIEKKHHPEIKSLKSEELKKDNLMKGSFSQKKPSIFIQKNTSEIKKSEGENPQGPSLIRQRKIFKNFNLITGSFQTIQI